MHKLTRCQNLCGPPTRLASYLSALRIGSPLLPCSCLVQLSISPGHKTQPTSFVCSLLRATVVLSLRMLAPRTSDFCTCVDRVVALIVRFNPCGEGHCFLVRSGRGCQSRRSRMKGASPFHALRSIVLVRRRCATKERTVLSILAPEHTIEGPFVTSPYTGRLPSHRIERALVSPGPSKLCGRACYAEPQW